MSLNIRYLTNGEKTAYQVVNTGVKPIQIDYYLTREEIPESIRHLVPSGEPLFLYPDAARVLLAMDYFYPDPIICNKKGYEGLSCIAEACKHGGKDFRKCKYLKKEKK